MWSFLITIRKLIGVELVYLDDIKAYRMHLECHQFPMFHHFSAKIDRKCLSFSQLL